MEIRFVLRGEFIPLDQLLKVVSLVGSGGEAHAAVDAGMVSVDGTPESRRRAKIRAGQQVRIGNDCVQVVAGD